MTAYMSKPFNCLCTYVFQIGKSITVMCVFKRGINYNIFLLQTVIFLSRHSLVIHIASDCFSLIFDYFTFIFKNSVPKKSSP